MAIVLGIACVLSGILYRMGGSDKYDTKWRDAGCPLVFLAAVWLLDGISFSYWWTYLLFFGASWGMLTTYWDKLFGYDNYYVHGLGCGLAGLFLIPVIPWWILVARIVICSVGMGLWSNSTTYDVKEEVGRGVLFIL